MKLIAALGLLGLGAMANAAPVYLECKMTTGTKEVLWNVTLDESTGAVSYTIPELGVVQKLPGVFMPDRVVFGAMEISRVNLSFTRKTVVSGVVDRTDQGQCKVTDPPIRQF
jgi:hypothetical protein